MPQCTNVESRLVIEWLSVEWNQISRKDGREKGSEIRLMRCPSTNRKSLSLSLALSCSFTLYKVVGNDATLLQNKAFTAETLHFFFLLSYLLSTRSPPHYLFKCPLKQVWVSKVNSLDETHHLCGGRWSPPCIPSIPAGPGWPGRWSAVWSVHHAGSHRCRVAAWRPAWRNRSSHRIHHCSRLLHSSARGHWLW